MNFSEFFISLLALSVLNIPVYAALDRYLIKHTPRYVQIVIFITYWSTAFFLQNFAPFIGVLILLIFVHNKENNKYLYFRNNHIWHIKLSDIPTIAGIALGARFFITAVNILFVFILDSVAKYNIKPQEVVTEFTDAGGLYKLALFLMMVVFAPVAEEYAFRYYIYNKLLLPRMPAFAAALLSSALFTLVHYNVGGIPSFFTLGLLCVYIFEKKGYYGAVIAHMVFNLVAVLILLFAGS